MPAVVRLEGDGSSKMWLITFISKLLLQEDIIMIVIYLYYAKKNCVHVSWFLVRSHLENVWLLLPDPTF